MGTKHIQIDLFGVEDIRRYLPEATKDRPVIIWDLALPGFHVILARLEVAEDPFNETSAMIMADDITFYIEKWYGDVPSGNQIAVCSLEDLEAGKLDDIRQIAADELDDVIREQWRRRYWHNTLVKGMPAPDVKRAVEKYRSN
jgi:predicted RNase H-like nuclease (RuvC/YqgF family)